MVAEKSPALAWDGASLAFVDESISAMIFCKSKWAVIIIKYL
jgi:hypothetical protein